MENKEIKVFKTLIHKETGEWGVMESFIISEVFQSEIPELWRSDAEENILKEYTKEYDFKEVVVLTRDEYERLKEIEKASSNLIEGIKKFASNINNMKTNNI